MKKNMENVNTEHYGPGHSHAGHMWMMAIFCAIPIIGFIVIAVPGISTPALETLLLVICMIGMAGMMIIMYRDSHVSEKSLTMINKKKEVNNETEKQ